MSTAWMPPDMSQGDKDKFASDYSDSHYAAAMAWESWAAGLPAESGVKEIRTGAQSVVYDGKASAFDAAMERARWHRARASVVSVDVGPTFAYGFDEDFLREEVTYESPPMPYLGAAQIQLPTRRVGPSDAENHS